jgi:pimeloyl-ACP methyl ester carboxylesterase
MNVTVPTSDNIALQADYYPSGIVDGPAVVLLHMIPPHFDRSSYPKPFIDKLLTAGFSVINLDRRGAGGSKGKASDAYDGTGGSLDVQAAVTFLAAQQCKFASDRLVLIGASNGTTSVYDYAIAASKSATLVRPSAMILLSPGDYTENQNKFALAVSTFATMPMLFAFPHEEAAWNKKVQANATASWKFKEYTPGAHGTKLFDSDPSSMSEVVSFAVTATTK